MNWITGAGAFLSWFAAFGFAALMLTAGSIMLSRTIKFRFILTDRHTYVIWVMAMTLSVGLAYLMNWSIWGMFLPQAYFQAARAGWIAAGATFAVGTLILTSRQSGDSEDRTGNALMLLGVIGADAIFCGFLIWKFEQIAAFMN